MIRFNEFIHKHKGTNEQINSSYEKHNLLHSNRTFELNDNIEISVNNLDEVIIDKIVSNFSFTYKKKKERTMKPIKIDGTMGDTISLIIILSNKTELKLNFHDSELKIHIKDKLVYDMDNINKNDIINILFSLYRKQLEKDNFKITKKISPFE